MQGADLIFARSPRLASRFIRVLDGGNFSHVAVAIDEANIVEATAHGVVKRPLSEWGPEVECVIYTPIVEEEDRLDIIRQAERIHAGGYEYGWATFIFMWVFWLSGGRLAVSGGAKTAICSGLVADCLHSGNMYFPNKSPFLMTPKDLQRMFEVEP